MILGQYINNFDWGSSSLVGVEAFLEIQKSTYPSLPLLHTKNYELVCIARDIFLVHSISLVEFTCLIQLWIDNWAHMYLIVLCKEHVNFNMVSEHRWGQAQVREKSIKPDGKLSVNNMEKNLSLFARAVISSSIYGTKGIDLCKFRALTNSLIFLKQLLYLYVHFLCIS